MRRGDGLTTRGLDLFIENTNPPATAQLVASPHTKPDRSDHHLEWGTVLIIGAGDLQTRSRFRCQLSALVCTKNGLTTAGYAMTEAEKLETICKKTPLLARHRYRRRQQRECAFSGQYLPSVSPCPDIPVWAWVAARLTRLSSSSAASFIS